MTVAQQRWPGEQAGSRATGGIRAAPWTQRAGRHRRQPVDFRGAALRAGRFRRQWAVAAPSRPRVAVSSLARPSPIDAPAPGRRALLRRAAALLGCATAAALVGSSAAAAELPSAGVHLAVLRLPGASDVASAMDTWAQEIRLRTSVAIANGAVSIRPEDPAIFRYPLLYWGGERAAAPLSEAAVAALRQHLSTGGTLVIDNTGRAEASAAFDASIRRELLRIFPQPLQKLPPGHVLFRAFYRLDRAVGRRADSHDLEGLRVGSHLAVLYTRNDLAGALARQSLGGFALAVVPGGETQREQALRLAVNLVMYALCLDYKDDHSHVMYLLRHKRAVSTPAAAPRNPGAGAE